MKPDLEVGTHEGMAGSRPCRSLRRVPWRPDSGHGPQSVVRRPWVVCGPSGVSLLTKKKTFNRRNWRRSVRLLIDLPLLYVGASPMSQRCGACSCCPGWGNGYSPIYGAAARRLSRKRACHECHDDASVQQRQVDNPGATSALVHLTSRRGTTARNMRDNGPPNERRVRQTSQRAGPAWANTAKCCEQ
jgi:hypothetical protein